MVVSLAPIFLYLQLSEMTATDYISNIANPVGEDDVSAPLALDQPRSFNSTVSVPGFQDCSLLPDGWVQSSGRYLFWVPPDNRHGIKNPRLFLTIPTSSHLRATKLDFTNFKCGTSWTQVRRGS